jgi:hypothetical protein
MAVFRVASPVGPNRLPITKVGNRLTPETAARVFGEMMPTGQKPMQLLKTGSAIRSIHGAAHTRLWNLD